MHLLSGKPYDALISYLITLSETGSTTESIRTIKKALKGVNVEKWLPIIAEDLQAIYEDKPELIRKKPDQNLYKLSIKNYIRGRYIFYELNFWTRESFQLYDILMWEFLKIKFHHSIFWVQGIIKSIEQGEVVTYLGLSDRPLNKYRELLIEKAKYENPKLFI